MFSSFCRTASCFAVACQHKLEAASLQLVDHPWQCLKQDMGSFRQPVVHQDNVAAGHMLQNVAGKRIGFIDNRIAAPNSPGDKLQPLSFQRKTQQRMTQADRRTEIARPYSADAVDALPPAFDLRSQPPRQEKAE